MPKTKTIILFLFLIFIAIIIILIAINKPSNSTPAQNFCTPESRLGEVCPELYQPVCGWSNESIQCIKYPCASTYGNVCEACHDGKVAYWTEEPCPA